MDERHEFLHKQVQQANARAEAAEAEVERLRQELEYERIRAEAAEDTIDGVRQALGVQAPISVVDEATRLREQVATMTAQLQEARTEYRVAREDFNELLDKTIDW